MLKKLKKIFVSKPSSKPKKAVKIETSNVSDPLAGRILPDPKRADSAKGFVPLAERVIDDNVMAKIEARIARAKDLPDDPQAILDAITFHEPVPQSVLLDTLRTFGLAIFPSIYDAERLAKVTSEYHDLIDNGAEIALDVAAREDTSASSYGVAIMRKAIDAVRYSETQALFGSKIIENVAQHLFAGQTFEYNRDLFVQWTDSTDTPASGALHWDKQLTFKSWLYVTDATEGYGAMRAGVGTAAWMRYLREDAMFDGVPYGDIDNRVAEKGFPVVSTGGPAGTFFLFLTDTAHGAAPVADGKRRNIMRARSRPVRVAEWSGWANKL